MNIFRHTLTCLLVLGSSLNASDYLFFSPEMISTHLASYNEEEKSLIDKDLEVVRSVCTSHLEGKPRRNGSPVYLATAGAPGARKSTILERFLQAHPEYSTCVYLDPDQRGLKFMSHTYYSQSLSAFAVAKDPDYAITQKKAYEKWRGASNYIALTLLEEAFLQRHDVAHGTTSTGPHIVPFYKALKKANYQIVLLLCSCEDALRAQAVGYRNEVQRFYQTTPEEVLSKGKYFAQRIADYFAYADTLYLFWSDDLFTPERLAAVFTEGEMTIHDADAYARFVDKFERDRAQLQQEGITL